MKIIKENELTDSGGVKYMDRGPDIDWGIISLQPGQIKPSHYHEKMGETFYTLEGVMTFHIKEQKVDIPKGTAIRLEAFEPHGLENRTNCLTKVLFIKEQYLPEDKKDYTAN